MNNTTDDWTDSDEVIDLAAVAATIRKQRLWVVLSVVTCTLAAVIYAFVADPIYRASVLLAPADSSRAGGLDAALGQLGGLASLAGLQLGNTNIAKEEALAVLKSRELTEAFIRDKDLMPLFFPKKWDKQRRRWDAQVTPPTSAEAYRYFSERVRSVLEDKKTGLVSLQIDWKDRVQAAEWANELVSRLNSEMQARAIASAEASVGYLEKELETTPTVDTRMAINHLIEAQIKQRMVANVTKEYAFRVVDEAMPPDEDDPIRPKKALVIVGGFLGGGVFSVIIILFLEFALGRRSKDRVAPRAVSASENESQNRVSSNRSS